MSNFNKPKQLVSKYSRGTVLTAKKFNEHIDVTNKFHRGVAISGQVEFGVNDLLTVQQFRFKELKKDYILATY